MGAYVAISSLMKTLEQLTQPNSRLVCGSEQLVESTYQNLCALQASLENVAKEATHLETLDILEKKIRGVVYKAEDAVDSSLRSIILADCGDDRERACESFNKELRSVGKEVESLREEVMHMEFNKLEIRNKDASTPSGRSATDDQQNVVVGMKDDFNAILNHLTAQTDDLMVIPIVGMGGIGKTTLARKAYLDSSIQHRFDTYAWVTISEVYNERQILLELVSSITGDRTQSYNQTKNDRLAEIVYRGLKRRRFLIVIDDLWSTDPWDQMRRSFPDDKNKSRIILTTRLNHVADYATCPDSPPHSISFLSLEDGWNLLRERLFQKDPCPPQLEKIGKHIIQQCRGLPLSIIVIVGLLGKMELTQDNWKTVERNLNSFFGTVYEQCEAIHSLSYTYLPQYLKACYLCVGGFPEDMEISVPKLIELWIAEQFIKGKSNRTLEVVAEEYLQELTDRSLILVGRRRANGRIKTFKIHDVLRQLCIKKAQRENVVHIMSPDMHSILSSDINSNERRVMVPITKSGAHVSIDFASKTRSLVFTSGLHKTSIDHLHSFVSHFKLLKVLDVLSIENDFSCIIPGLVHLIYVAANIVEIPSLAKLWNLQTIIFGQIKRCIRFDVLKGIGSLELPLEIWTMSEMRHLKVDTSICMPNPLEAEIRGIGQGPLFLRNLQRLHLNVIGSTIVVEILRRTPSLNKLKIFLRGASMEWSAFFDCLSLLPALETLHLSFLCDPFIPLNWDTFLPNLKQLKLSYAIFPWEYMAVLAKLPNLKVLKLRSAFDGKVWRLNEDIVFHKLKYLLIEFEDLVRWDAASDNFPMLEQLVLRRLEFLEEIPPSIGEIMTLQLIKIHFCSSGAISSAKKIRQEQESWGNYGLRLQIK